jgi:hypothetical protein
MSKQPYFQLVDVLEEIRDLRDNGVTKGESCGLFSLDEYFTLKKGFPLFIAGAPYSGKTELVLEILLNTSILYGWKHFIYVGEGGDVQNIFGELIHKHAQKPFIKTNPYHIEDLEFFKSQAFITKHFVIANHDKEFTVGEFYATVIQAEEEYKMKFDTTLFDPFNDIKDETDGFGGREDKYLASALKTVRVDAKRNNRINILVNHIADVRAIQDKETGNRYMPPALPNEWAGGRTWWRRAFTMILVYRPPTWMKDNSGMPYAENESHIYIQKSKPKGVGKVGMGKIFWDWKKNRYFCYAPGGQQLYSCQTPETEKEYINNLTEINNDFFTHDYQGDQPF